MKHKTLRGALVFLAVAFVVPWAGWLAVRDDALSLWLFPLFASIGGFAAAFAEGGKAGLIDFSKRVTRISGASRYGFFAILLPVLIGLGYLRLKDVSFASFFSVPEALLGLSLGAALLTGPLAEEFGWRGYVQRGLLQRAAPFWAALLTGFIWWIWHFALYRTSVFASASSALPFLAYLETWSVFLVFLVQRSEGSVWPAVALHWAANVHPGVLQALLPGVDGSVLPGGSKGSLFYLATALAFVAVNRRFYFSRVECSDTAGVREMTEPVPVQLPA